MKDSKKTTYTHINLLKIIACFLVIVNHTINHVLNFKTEGVDFFFCLLFSLCKIAVPLFIICSGYLILKKEYTYKKVFQNIIKVFVPLLVISIFLYVKDTGLKNINILDFFEKFISEPYIKPYWYLYMLLGLYFVTPFIQKMVKDFKEKDYYYFIVFFIVVPAVLKLLLVCFGIKYSSYFLMAFIPYIIGYYVYGNYIANGYRSININIARLVFVLAFVAMFLLTYIPSINGQGISYKFDDISSLPVVLMSLSIFYIFEGRFKNSDYSNRSLNIINTVGGTTFGVYLFHHLIGYKIFTIGVVQSIFEFNVFIGYILYVILVFILCCIITYILKKIPGIKKFL